MNNFTKITRNQYKELFNKATFSIFFHNADWHEFLEKQFKWIAFEYYSYGGKMIFPIARFKVLNKERAVSLPFCEYGGPLLFAENLNLENFERDARGEFDSLKIKFHPQTLKTSNLELRTSNISTHFIENLKSTTEQEIWDSFRKTLRHEITHSQNQGLVIRECRNLKELRKFYNLYVANLKRRKTIPYPWQIVRFLCQNPSSELLLAFRGDKIVGGSLFLKYSGFIHYFLSASDYKHKDLGASYLILWEKIKSLIGKDVVLDLGATPNDSSLYTFKSGWGGKEYPIIVSENEKSLEKLRSSRLRNLFALLPNFAVKILSSRLIKYRL